MRYFSQRTEGRGFTLIELLVVIAIIALLSSVVLSSLNSARAKSRDAFRLSQMKEVQKALEMYYAKYGVYPYGANTESGRTNSCAYNASLQLSEPIGDWDGVMQLLVTEGFLSSIPRDPINTGYATANASRCFKYASYTVDDAIYRRCSTNAVADRDIVMRNYGYVLMFSSEATSFNLPLSGWPLNIYTYCILGPLK